MQKQCTRCGETKPATLEFFPFRKSKNRFDSWCRACYSANTKRIQTKDPERKKRQDKEWREKQGDDYKERRRLNYERLPLTEKERRKEHAKKHNNKLKREALERYGGAFCHCCGETEILMLSLDHIEGDGASHRKVLTGSTRSMPTSSYVWAKKNGYPPIFQVMCFNCNWARHWNNGICPHSLLAKELTQVPPAYQAA